MEVDDDDDDDDDDVNREEKKTRKRKIDNDDLNSIFSSEPKQGKGLIHMTQGGVHDAQKINNKFGKLKIK